MKTTRKTEITVETHEITTIRVSETRRVTAFCKICRAMVVHIPVSDAAAMLRLPETALFDLVRAGKVHLFEAEGTAALVCTDSIRPLA
jgi:hypothetical protein